MKGKVLYALSIIFILLPWLFLSEVLPIPYYRLSVIAEVLIEGSMLILLAVMMFFLKKELKRVNQPLKGEDWSSGKSPDQNRTSRKALKRWVKLLFVLSAVTLAVLVLILLVIGVSFTIL